MEDDPDHRSVPAEGSRAGRASAAVLGAAAMLVLSFGPSALALSPASPAAPAPSARVVLSTPVSGPAAAASARAEDSADQSAEDGTDTTG